MASVTLDVPGKRAGHLPSFLHLYHQLPPLEASPTDTPSFSPTQYLGSRCEYTYFTGDMPRAQGTKYQPGSCCWFPDSEDVQAAPGWAHSPLKQNFLCRLPFSFPATCLIIFTWKGAESLFSSLGFVKSDMQTLPSADRRWTLQIHQLSSECLSPKEGRRTEEDQGSCAALLDWETGIPQQREEKQEGD